MNKKLMVMVTTMAFLIAMLPAFAAATDYTCDSCASCEGYITNSSGGDTVTLTQNIANDGSNNCLDINHVYDVDFDCDGYELLCSGLVEGQRFITANNWTYSTMSNCEIRHEGWSANSYFMNMQDVSNSIFEDMMFNVSGAMSQMLMIGGPATNTIIRDMIVYYDNNVSSQSVFSIGDSFNTTFDNVSIYSTGNGRGLWVTEVEHGLDYEATVTNSMFQNLEIGVYAFQPGGGETTLFYNNIFNSTDNYYEQNSPVNHFNTTKTLGTNIVGGPYIGGNWWEGFSNTCNDTDVDGICDDPYTDSGDTDYLPLAVFTPTPPTPPVVEQFPLLGLIPLIVAIAVLIGFVGAFISGLLDLKTALTWIVMAGVAIVIIGVIYTI